MKTAKISIYLMHGTNNYCADIFYKGKLIASFDRRVLKYDLSQSRGLSEYAQNWALNNGFTHAKILIE